MIAPSIKSEHFVDSNIWIYAFIKSPASIAKTNRAAQILRQANLSVSSQIVNEVCRQLLRNGIAESALSPIIRSFYNRCQVVTLTREILLDASALRQEYSLSFWDGLIVASALSIGATSFYTEDLHHGQVIRGQLTIVNLFIAK